MPLAAEHGSRGRRRSVAHLHRTIFAGILLLAATLPGRAFAGDGRLEINDTCAVQTGCFPGDTPGYPVTIDGSAGTEYLLTSRLVLPNENTDGISIGAHDVRVDLNGFSIVRSGCEGATSTCKPGSGTGNGIDTFGSASPRGTSVRNGSIVGMGANGVVLGDQARVVGLRVRWNRESGIILGIGSSVTRSSAFDNGAFFSYPAISLGAGSRISDCSVASTSGTGILVEDGTTVSGNTAFSNLGNGVEGDDGALLDGNAAYQNGFDGVVGGLSAIIENNAAYNNGNDGISAEAGSSILDNATALNGSDGIATSGSAIVQGNAVYMNTIYGLNLGTGSAYRLNVIADNAFGIVTGGVDLLTNACNGSTSCP